jgi:hypothetical protein
MAAYGRCCQMSSTLCLPDDMLLCTRQLSITQACKQIICLHPTTDTRHTCSTVWMTLATGYVQARVTRTLSGTLALHMAERNSTLYDEPTQAGASLSEADRCRHCVEHRAYSTAQKRV